MRLAGKTAVITGASTGIGRACALRFAREGARLVLADRQVAEAESLQGEIERAGGTCTVVEADVASRADNERMIDVCVEQYGSIDIPVTLAWGEDDKSFKIALGERMAADIPNAELVRIPDSYTFVSLDQPERLAALI